MAARSTHAGIKHLTVVPANFDPEIESEPNDEKDSNSETAPE